MDVWWGRVVERNKVGILGIILKDDWGILEGMDIMGVMFGDWVKLVLCIVWCGVLRIEL